MGPDSRSIGKNCVACRHWEQSRSVLNHTDVKSIGQKLFCKVRSGLSKAGMGRGHRKGIFIS